MGLLFLGAFALVVFLTAYQGRRNDAKLDEITELWEEMYREGALTRPPPRRRGGGKGGEES